MSNNNDDIGVKCHQLYLMSKKRMEEDDPDLADEVIVALWNTVENLNTKKKSLEETIKQQTESLANYYHKQDILESKIALLTGEKSLNSWQPSGEMQ
jgi:hypothetical protein